MAIRFGNTGTAGNDYLFNFKGADVVDAGAGNDKIFGYFDQDHNSFKFERGDGNDQLFGYQSGVDDIDLTVFSPKEISYTEGHDAHGNLFTEIHAGGIGGQGINHINIKVWGVHGNELTIHAAESHPADPSQVW